MFSSRVISIVVGLLASVSIGSRAPSKSALEIGMVFVDMTQYLDTGPIDLLALMGERYILAFMVGGKIDSQKVKMNIHYISQNGKDPIQTAEGLSILPTVGRFSFLLTFKLLPNSVLIDIVRQCSAP
jgi:hypothetical protein